MPNRTSSTPTVGASSTEPVLRGLVALGPALVADRARDTISLTLTPAGLEVRAERAGRTGPSTVPELVPWPRLAGFDADRQVALPGGGVGHLLVVVGSRPDGTTVALHRFAASAPQVSSLVTAMVPWAQRWAVARGGSSILARVTARASAGITGIRERAGAVAGLAWEQVQQIGWVAAGTDAMRRVAVRNPAHGLGERRRLAPLVAAGMVLAVFAGGATTVASAGARTIHHAPLDVGNRDMTALVPAAASVPVHLAPATSRPIAAPPSLVGQPALRPHEVFGYAPYWTLPESTGFNVADLTTLAYFSVDANGNGSIDESGPGWNGYQSQDLVNLVDRAHTAGDRVVLTVTCFSQSALDQITSDPQAAGTLSSALVPLVAAKNLDGVNFDFEGTGSADRAGLTKLLTSVSHSLHAANPHWQVTMATYASAAGDPNGFYDVAALAPAMDGFFVMAYDMNDPVVPSATAPLVGGGFNDNEALAQYTAVVPAAKVILGVPYYGYDWPTTDGTRSAQSMGAPTPLSYGEIAAAGHPTYWDPSTQTAWTSYEVGGQWHETFFDNPVSLALKAELASFYRIGGVGIWALGMDGNDPAMLAALVGKAAPVKDYSTGPTSTSSSVSPPGTASTTPATTATTGTPAPGGGASPTGGQTTAEWQGRWYQLTAVSAPSLQSFAGATDLGPLQAFQTGVPALACLETGTPPEVWHLATMPGTDLVLAVNPVQCVSAAFTFPAPSDTGASPPTTTTTAPPTPTTTTTAPPTTTTTAPPTTTTTAPPTTTIAAAASASASASASSSGTSTSTPGAGTAKVGTVTG